MRGLPAVLAGGSLFWAVLAACRPGIQGGRGGFGCPPTPPLACFVAPLPRRGRIDPRPPSPVGKGVTKVISCKGLRPLHPRGLNPSGTGTGSVSRTRRGGVSLASPAEPATPASKGGVPFFSPANPAFGLLFCPLSPDPLPGGKGEIFSFLMQGASPLASPGAEPMVRRKTDRNRFPASGAAVHLFGRGL